MKLMSCIMGNVGSKVFSNFSHSGESQDISASAASIVARFPILKKVQY